MVTCLKVYMIMYHDVYRYAFYNAYNSPTHLPLVSIKYQRSRNRLYLHHFMIVLLYEDGRETVKSIYLSDGKYTRPVYVSATAAFRSSYCSLAGACRYTVVFICTELQCHNAMCGRAARWLIMLSVLYNFKTAFIGRGLLILTSNGWLSFGA